ncbi:hypothetical protein Bbelb_125610 [Branchiostoma belcheri]|nr:hypothetical protein Bbelb_125610 [Branchiostoma belcheri]
MRSPWDHSDHLRSGSGFVVMATNLSEIDGRLFDSTASCQEVAKFTLQNPVRAKPKIPATDLHKAGLTRPPDLSAERAEAEESSQGNETSSAGDVRGLLMTSRCQRRGGGVSVCHLHILRK